MRKILSVLIVVLTFTNLFLPTSATEICALVSDEVVSDAGETFETDIRIVNNCGIAALGVDIEYDSNILNLISVRNGNIFDDECMTIGRNISENPYKVNWISPNISNTEEDGVLLTLKFKVYDYIAGDSTSVKVNINQAFNESFDDVNIEPVSFNVITKSSSKVMKSVSLTPPVKTEYRIGEELDLSGMILSAYYSDGTVADITDYAVITGFDSQIEGDQLVYVSYGRYMTAFLIKIISDDNSMKIKICNSSTKPGEYVDIPIELDNNSGIAGLFVKFTYDKNIMSLIGISNGNVFKNTDMTAGGNIDDNPYNIFWVDSSCDKNCCDNGILATIRFKISDDADVGNYDFNLEIIQAIDCDFNDININVIQGKINVCYNKCLLGDADKNGTVDIADATFIQKYIVMLGVSEDDIDIVAGDCNHDGKVDIRDATYIQLYIAELRNEYKIGDYFYY